MEGKSEVDKQTDNQVLQVKDGDHITPAPVLRNIMNYNVITISLNESIVEAANMMSEHRTSCLVVVDNSRIIGIITESDLLYSVFTESDDWEKVKVSEIMSSPVEIVRPDLSILDASKVMSDGDFRRLPVMEKGSLVGIVTQTDVTEALTTYGIGKQVGDIMKSDVIVVETDTNVAQAAEIMGVKRISCVVAVDKNMPVGIFTERDFMKKIVSAQIDPWQITIEEVMSLPVITISPDYSIFSASRMMNKVKIRKLIVMNNNKLCGIVTQTDILKAISNLCGHSVTKEALQPIN